MTSKHKLFIHTVCGRVLSGTGDIFIPAGDEKSVLCYRVCLVGLCGMGGGREVDGKGEGRGGRSVSSSASCLFFLDPISL